MTNHFPSLLKEVFLQGNFGIEKESLRITREGYLAQSKNPFEGEKNIVMDFCENQTEINTDVFPSAKEAVHSLLSITRQMQKKLKSNNELLWPFSNPPYIKNNEDIPVAQYDGDEEYKTAYRNYLSCRYGRYKMTLSGIHVNFSFGSGLLQRAYQAAKSSHSFQRFQDELYLKLAKKLSIYGWLLTALTAASPLLDSSFHEEGIFGQDLFNGMASTRCSELGYWNFFTPIFFYEDIQSYAASIQHYVNEGYLDRPAELYFPIRLKPKGENTLENLRKGGVSHIELRMFDLNPLEEAGINLLDLQFTHLFILYLAFTPDETIDVKDQIQGAQNFKNAAHYDLQTVRIFAPNGTCQNAQESALCLLSKMEAYFDGFSKEVDAIIAFEKAKFLHPETRYAHQIKEQFFPHFVQKGVALAKKRQEFSW